MEIIRINKGKPEIDKKAAFTSFLGGKLPAPSKSFKELFNEFDASAKKINDAITREALSNAHGDWYEWLLAIKAWNLFKEGKCRFLALLMPNVRSFDVSTLYTDEVADLVADLKKKVEATAGVQLITSNPDFVIIDPENHTLDKSLPGVISFFDQNTLTQLETIYSYFKSVCDFEDIVGYASVKTSLRPDRRLQIPHEGSLMKAMYTHILTRKWLLDPKGIKYYAIARTINEADIKALRTVATHSITTVSSLPQAAVDEVFAADSLQEAEKVFLKILN